MTGLNKKIVVFIDDGINSRRFETGPLEFDIEITPELEVIERKDYDQTLANHGSGCGAIFKKYAPDAPLASIKILNDLNQSRSSQLVKALEWCISKPISVINLSLGTVQPRDFAPLKKVINTLYDHGIIVVAAANNNHQFTYPAALTNVIGVKCDCENHLQNDEFTYDPFPLDGIDFTANSDHFLVTHLGEEKNSGESNSYAAPLITAHVYNILKREPGLSFEQVKERLISRAVKDKPICYYPTRFVDWDHQAYLLHITDGGEQKPHLFAEDIDIIGEDKLIVGSWNRAKTDLEKWINNFISKRTDLDTIIISTSGLNLNKSDGFTSFFDFITHLEMNIIFLGDIPLRPEEVMTGEVMGKFWYPPDYSLLKSEPIYRPFETPAIAICDGTAKWETRVIAELASYFEQDLFKPLVITDSSPGVLASFNYFPWRESFGEGKDQLLYDLNRLDLLYDPGIFLLGCQRKADDNSFFKELSRTEIIDIFILIGTDISSNGQKIHISEKDLRQEGWARELYNKILKLYDYST